MKKLIAIILTLMLVTISATMAEPIPFSEWLQGFSAGAEEPVVQDEPLAAEGTSLFPNIEEVTAEFSPIGAGSRGDDVLRLQEKLIELGVLNSKADGILGPMTEAALKTVQKSLGWEETGEVLTQNAFDTIMSLEPGYNANLAVGTSSEWSEWMIPEYNAENRCFTVSTVYLGDKQIGEPYTCQVEIEYVDVTEAQNLEGKGFLFRTQGAVDNTWGEVGVSNIWRSLVNLNEAPANGVYKYTMTKKIDDLNVGATTFDIGFRCDYWASGQFRVRCVKVEKGMSATEWTPAKADISDGINLAVGTSSEWSEWMIPEYNAENRCFTVSTAYLGDKQIGEPYTCQVEIEYADVTETPNLEGKGFLFRTQGAVDNTWGEVGVSNIWRSLVNLNEAPANGVYKYTMTKKIDDLNVGATTFDIGFRCDYWASGQFRIRCVKVEKGMSATEWTPAKADISDGINLAVGTSSEWSEWMIPEYSAENRCFTVSTAYLGDKQIGEPYTCQVEIEYADVTETPNLEGKGFLFRTQGAVDNTWGEVGASNIWRSLVNLNEAPANGVYKYTMTKIIDDLNVGATTFDIGFRCDYWASGQFRIRCVKVEKGMNATEWTPAR